MIDDHTERLGSRKNTDGGKKTPHLVVSDGGGLAALHVTGLVEIIGLVTTATEHMTTENKHLLAPKSHALPERPYGTLVRGWYPSDEEDPDSGLIENGILRVRCQAIFENSPLEGKCTGWSVIWNI
jgi:hypothetical protein